MALIILSFIFYLHNTIMSSFIRGHSSQPERFCKYIHRYCNQTRLEGYDYCIRHILEDKFAPFKQCTYVNQPNKKRCTNAAPKSEKSDKRENVLCPFHAKRALLKVRITAPKKKIPVGPTAFLKSLEKYCTDNNHDSSHNPNNAMPDRNDVPLCGKVPTSLSDVESNINEETSPLEAKARVESIDDDFCWVEKFGDCLDNAGVYTHKEVLTIAKEKIERLQQLYCEELKVVFRELGSNQKECLEVLKNVKQSKESNEASQQSDDTIKGSFHASIKSYKRSGIESVLRHESKKRSLNANKAPVSNQKCTYEETGIKCTNDAIVLTKFCKLHILMDPKQLLYKACPYGIKEKCKFPVLVVEEEVSCDQHLHRLLQSKISSLTRSSPSPESVTSKTFQSESEPFQSMDDIASLGLDAIVPGSLFGLDQFGEPGESTDTVLSEDQTDLLTIQPISSIPPNDILCDSRKSESELNI